MGGIQRFERRWANWIRMRNAMHWRAYYSERMRRMRLAALSFLVGFSVMCAATAILGYVHAQQVPQDAIRHKLTLKREAQRVWGLNAPIASFAAQIHQESAWQDDAVSPAGAQGLAQFMPSTATWISGLYPSLEDRSPRNPTWAIRAMVIYDAQLFTQIRASDDQCQRFAFALSAYNGGLGWVHKRQSISTNPGRCFDATCDINPGITPAAQRENAGYPRSILLRLQPTYAQWGPGICP